MLDCSNLAKIMLFVCFMIPFVLVSGQDVDTPLTDVTSFRCEILTNEIVETCWELPNSDTCSEIKNGNYSENPCTRELLQEAKLVCERKTDNYQKIYETIKLMVLSNKLICTLEIESDIKDCWKQKWFYKVASAAINNTMCRNILYNLIDESDDNCTQLISLYTNALANELNCAQSPDKVNPSKTMSDQPGENLSSCTVINMLTILCHIVVVKMIII